MVCDFKNMTDSVSARKKKAFRSDGQKRLICLGHFHLNFLLSLDSDPAKQGNESEASPNWLEVWGPPRALEAQR